MVLEYRRPVVRHKATATLSEVPAPRAVLESSLADVSCLAGLLVDKFVYHLPLYRQHQRLEDAGITLSRTTLTTYVQRAIELLAPIAQAQHGHILQEQSAGDGRDADQGGTGRTGQAEADLVLAAVRRRRRAQLHLVGEARQRPRQGPAQGLRRHPADRRLQRLRRVRPRQTGDHPGELLGALPDGTSSAPATASRRPSRRWR